MSKTKLFASIRKRPCIVCGTTPSEVCHIRTKGASGINEVWNLFPACSQHHREQHQKGIVSFFKKYSHALGHISIYGWDIEVINGKGYLRRDE